MEGVQRMENIIKILKQFKDISETMADLEIIKYQEENDELKKIEMRNNIKTYFKVADIIEINIKNLEGEKND